MPANDINDVKIMAKSVVCEDSTLRGDITISPGCVVHPSATIIAEAGPIVLGENCIVEEYATIVHCRWPRSDVDGNEQQPEEASSTEKSSVLAIGPHNVFEVGCTVEAHRIGEKNVFECKSYVGPRVGISSGCIVGAGVRLLCDQYLPENTVIYGRESLQREAIEKHGSQTLQIDFLRKVLPNYHHLRKPNHDPKKSRSAVV